MAKPVASTNRRELIIGLLVGAVFVALLVYGVLSMGSKVSGNTLTGKIVEKRFVPLEEEQVSISLDRQKKMRTERIGGDYIFEVDVRGRAYLVPVSKEVYENTEVGGRWTFPKPQE